MSVPQLQRGARRLLDDLEADVLDARVALQQAQGKVTSNPVFVERRISEALDALARQCRRLHQDLEPLLYRRERNAVLTTMAERLQDVEGRVDELAQQLDMLLPQEQSVRLTG